MLAQPTPVVTNKDVARVLHREFPGSHAAKAYAVLAAYGSTDGHREVDRVRMAALKLAAGDLNRLETAIANAITDYRDTLAQAEYPEYFRSVTPGQNISPAEIQRIVDADWSQYNDWLRR